MCLYPKLIQNRKYIPNKKNKGIPPQPTDTRVLSVPIKCGKCMECKKQKSREWQVRLSEEIRIHQDSRFVTLSFSPQSISDLKNTILKEDPNIKGYILDNNIATLAVRRFLERWRKQYKKSIKHWFVTELGQTNTERLHIHGLIFTNEPNETIEKIWKYGNTWSGDYVNEKTINYIVKYIYKTDQKHKLFNPIILCSPGIGNNYINRYDSKLNKYKNLDTNELYKTRTGIKLPLPIYYRNKIYNEDEREKLWINRLDTETRYINGHKIDISETMEKYWTALDEARKINKLLGYNDDTKTWKKSTYQEQLDKVKKSY